MDPWAKLREQTQARIGLGRAGDGIPTRALLEFQLGHARARDAVHGGADFERIAREIDYPTVRVASLARDRATYLLRPDLGRKLGPHGLEKGEWDLAIVIADGLSATAVNDHAVAMTRAIFARTRHLSVPPVVLASNARVALGDEIGWAMGAKLVAVLIGERPGLSVANSLGIYLTWGPKPGVMDSERNCISNIHSGGLSYAEASHKLLWLVDQARRQGLTGVQLKEAAGELPASLADATETPNSLPS